MADRPRFAMTIIIIAKIICVNLGCLAVADEIRFPQEERGDRNAEV